MMAKPTSASRKTDISAEVAEDDNKNPNNLPTIFISYRWNDTKKQVRQVADYLKSLNKYKVWIDTEEMYGDKNERMEEGIREASVVVVFFSDDYQTSRDCRKEAESADRNDKPMVFVKMQRPKCQFHPWFAPIIGNNIFVDYFKYQNPGEEIRKDIDRVLSGAHAIAQHDGKQQSNKQRKFVMVKVPKFTRYQKRSEEADICGAIFNLCSANDADKQGALVICGGGGTGKTTLVAQLVHLHGDYLSSQCRITHVIWLNCFKWAGDAFDENEFTRALLDLAERAEDHSGFGSLKEMTDFFDRHNDRLLVILDDVFSAGVLETMHDYCPNVACLAITRDSEQLLAKFGLVADTCRLQELSDDEILEMFESAYRLKGRLERDHLAKLAAICCGLPLVVSILAARFQDCETSREIVAEYQLILEEVKVKDLQITGPYGTISRLFEFSIQQLDEQLRYMFYSFLLFDPAEPVDVEDLAILWNASNLHRALVRCRQIARKSLIRNVIPSNGSNNSIIPGKHSDFFLVHQILHEAAVDNAIKTHFLAVDLADLRTQIICGFCEDNSAKFDIALEVLDKVMACQKRHLIETILTHVDVVFLAQLVGRRSERFTKNHRTFLHFLYNTDWPDNGGPFVTGVNHSVRLLRQFFGRVVYHNRTKPLERVSVLPMMTERDDDGNCLLIQLFREADQMKAHRNDRRKLAIFLYPVDGCFKRYQQLLWFDIALKSGNNIPPIIEAAAKGDLETVRILATQSPSLLKEKHEYGDTPLIAAARMGHLDVVKYLFKLDPSDDHLNTPDAKGANAFLVASYYGQLEIVKFLFENRPNGESQLEARDRKLRSPFNLAAMNGALDVMEFFYGKRESVAGDVERAGRTAFMLSSRFGHIEVVKFLVGKCKRVHDSETDRDGMTPLMYAASSGHLEIVKLLCELGGASFGTKSKQGVTALMFAASHGQIEIVQYLFDKDPIAAIEHQQVEKNKTALVLAAEHGDIEVVKFLGEKCRHAMLSGDGSNEMLWNNFVIAAKYGHLDAVKVLVGDSNNSDVIDPIAFKIGCKYFPEAYRLAKKFNLNQSVAAYLQPVVNSQE